MKVKKCNYYSISFFKLFVFFILGSIAGCFFEEVLFYFQNGYWEYWRDLLIGPFNTLYGFAIIVYIIVSGRNCKKRNIFLTFILSALLGDFIEYTTGLIFEKVLHIKFWDYSNMVLNIGGKTTIPFMMIWELGGTIFLKFIYPLYPSKYLKVSSKIYPVYIIILILFVINIIISYTAFIRTLQRLDNKEPLTNIGTIYDKYFNNEFMLNKYPVLKKRKQKVGNPT